MIDRLVENSSGDVGEHGKARDPHSHVSTYNGFRNRGHSDSIRTNSAKKSNFGRRFVSGAGHGSVNTFAHVEAAIFAGSFELAMKFWIVDLRLVDKPGAPAVFIRTGKGIGPDQIDVIRYDHQISPGKIGIDCAGSIREDQDLRPKPAYDARAEGNLCHCVALVVMHASF